MCNLSLTAHCSLEKDKSEINHSCVSPKMGCLENIGYVFLVYLRV